MFNFLNYLFILLDLGYSLSFYRGFVLPHRDSRNNRPRTYFNFRLCCFVYVRVKTWYSYVCVYGVGELQNEYVVYKIETLHPSCISNPIKDQNANNILVQCLSGKTNQSFKTICCGDAHLLISLGPNRPRTQTHNGPYWHQFGLGLGPIRFACKKVHSF